MRCFKFFCFLSFFLLIRFFAVAGSLAQNNLHQCKSALAEGKFNQVKLTLRSLAESKNQQISREAIYLLASESVAQKPAYKPDDAEKLLEKLAFGSVDDDWQGKSLLHIAKRKAGNKKYEEAIVLLSRYIRKHPESAFAILAAELSGDVYSAQEKTSDAIKSYQYALSLATYLKTLTLYSSGFPEEVNLARIEDKLSRSKGNVKKLSKVKADEPMATFNFAQAAQRNQNFAQAETMYKSIVKNYPEHDLIHQCRYLLALCQYKQEQYSKAIISWRAFIEDNPAGPWRGPAYVSLGDCILESTLNVSDAQSYYARLATNNISEKSWFSVLPDAYEQYGICLLYNNNTNDAAGYFSKALCLRPTISASSSGVPVAKGHLLEMCRAGKHPVLYNEMVMQGRVKVKVAIFFISCWAEYGNYERALAMCKRILSDEIEGASSIQKAYITYKIAAIMRVQQKHDEAARLFRECCSDFKLTPIAPAAMLELATLHFCEAQNNEGLSVYKQLWESFPNSPEAPKAMYYFAYSKFFSAEYKKSLAVFEKLVEKYPSTWESKQAKDNMIKDLKKMVKEGK